MTVLMKIAPGRNNSRKVHINVMNTPNGDKKGYDVWINEVVNGHKLDGIKAKLFMSGKNDDFKFEISGPIRRVDKEGKFVFEGRSNGDNDYIDKDNNIVLKEEDAAQQHQYIKDNTGGFLFGKIATIKVVNNKIDKENGEIIPTKSTYLSAKIYSDAESYKIARTHYESTICNESDKPSIEARLKKEIADLGTWNNLFINSGVEFLTEKGVEFRTYSDLEGDMSPS